MCLRIFTIGYGNRSILDFINLLDKYNIQGIVDVRSRPYSRFRPDYNTKRLASHLKEHNIGYIHKVQLGGRPKDDTLYPNELPDYDKIRLSEPYRKGIDYLMAGAGLDFNYAIMCAETDHKRCHRSKLIGVDLARSGVQVSHILKDGSIEDHIVDTLL